MNQSDRWIGPDWSGGEKTTWSDHCKKPDVQTQDLEWLARQTPLIDLYPLAVSCELSHLPTTIRGKSLWPDLVMLEAVAQL